MHWGLIPTVDPSQVGITRGQPVFFQLTEPQVINLNLHWSDEADTERTKIFMRRMISRTESTARADGSTTHTSSTTTVSRSNYPWRAMTGKCCPPARC